MSILSDELTTDPLGVGYKPNATECAGQLEALTQRGPISRDEVQAQLLTSGEWVGIELASAGVDPVSGDALALDPRKAALTFVRAMDVRESFSMQDEDVYEAVEGNLSALVAAGLMTAPSRAAVLDLCENQRSRRQALEEANPNAADAKLGWRRGRIGAGAVKRARGEPETGA